MPDESLPRVSEDFVFRYKNLCKDLYKRKHSAIDGEHRPCATPEDQELVGEMRAWVHPSSVRLQVLLLRLSLRRTLTEK